MIELEEVYEAWEDNIWENLDEFYDKCMENGESTFSVPAVEFVSALNQRDRHILSRLGPEVVEANKMRAEISREAKKFRSKFNILKRPMPWEYYFDILSSGIENSSIQEMLLEAREFDREMSREAQLAASRKSAEEHRLLSIYEAEIEYEEEQGKYQGRSEDSRKAEMKTLHKNNMGTILGYFEYVRESGNPACRTSSIIDEAEKAICDLREEEKREAEHAALAEYLEYEYGYDTDI